MAKSSRLKQVLSALRNEEGFLEAQLGKVRDAIGALAGVGKEYQRLQRTREVKAVVSKRKRKMTAVQRKAVSARMKKYWAKRRNAKK